MKTEHFDEDDAQDYPSFQPDSENQHFLRRRTFCKSVATLALGMVSSPIMTTLAFGTRQENEMPRNRSMIARKAKTITILHTSDIHGQVFTHDEFFLEEGEVIYKKRGGLAVLKSMLNTIRAENPENTILIDGGDCFQGSGIAALSKGKAMVPLMNNIGYDLVLPGNWEVVYKKQMMIDVLEDYHAAKICANMFHESADEENGKLIFEPYWTKDIAGIKIGFIGYTDPNVPLRQSPAFSKGIRFTKPIDDVAKYVTHLKEVEKCSLVFLVAHLGLAQQVNLANTPQAQGIDYILGGDTHERVRKPLEGKYAKVTEPGAFGSFVARLDLLIEGGEVKDQNYELLDVDPDKYKPDREMLSLIERERAPYRKELDQVIGKTKLPLVRYYVLETPMDNVITDAMMWKFKPDLAISNGFRFCPPLFPRGKKREALITMDYLWSMVPVNSEIKSGMVGGKQLWDWLEKELHNVFAKNPSERLGGWLVRMQGMHINFTMNNGFGSRLNWVRIGNEPIDLARSYVVVTCEREGDPVDTLCRLGHVTSPTYMNLDLHQTLIDYLKAHSPISPRIEGRVTATDAPQTLLSQLEGYGYNFF